MELRHLRQAVALADHESFSKAAVALHLSQSALTRGIQALEEQVGSRLFDRVPSGVEPTNAGLLFLKRARSLLSQVEELEIEMGLSGPGDERSIRIAAGPYAAPIAVIPAISKLWEGGVKPRIEVDVTQWARAIRLVRQGRVEFAVAEDSELDPQGLELVKLQSHPAYAIVRKGHPLERSTSVGLGEVFKWPLAFVTGVPARLSSRFPKLTGGTPFTPGFRCEDLGLVNRLIATTDLVGLMPLCLIEEELESGKLSAVALKDRWMQTSFSVIRVRGAPIDEAAGDLIERIVEADRISAEKGRELAERYGCAMPGGRKTRSRIGSGAE